MRPAGPAAFIRMRCARAGGVYSNARRVGGRRLFESGARGRAGGLRLSECGAHGRAGGRAGSVYSNVARAGGWATLIRMRSARAGRAAFIRMRCARAGGRRLFECGARERVGGRAGGRRLYEFGAVGRAIADLSKVFDCLNHNLMIAKLHAYGCDFNFLKLISSYLQNRFHRVKVNSTYSSWVNIISGVSQGSTLGPLLFNIYLSDLLLFLEDTNIASYADDTTPYICNNNLGLVIAKLEEDLSLLIKWINNIIYKDLHNLSSSLIQFLK